MYCTRVFFSFVSLWFSCLTINILNSYMCIYICVCVCSFIFENMHNNMFNYTTACCRISHLSCISSSSCAQLLDRRCAFGLYPLSRHIQFPSSMSLACQQLRKHCKTLCYTNLSNIKFMLIPVPMLGCLKNEGSLKPRVSILKLSNLR